MRVIIAICGIGAFFGLIGYMWENADYPAYSIAGVVVVVAGLTTVVKGGERAKTNLGEWAFWLLGMAVALIGFATFAYGQAGCTTGC